VGSGLFSETHWEGGGGAGSTLPLKPSYPGGANPPMTQENRVYRLQQNATLTESVFKAIRDWLKLFLAGGWLGAYFEKQTPHPMGH
jgi:hypothetical protein